MKYIYILFISVNNRFFNWNNVLLLITIYIITIIIRLLLELYVVYITESNVNLHINFIFKNILINNLHLIQMILKLFILIQILIYIFST